MNPVPEYHGIDRARFEAEIVPAARPAILRGLVSDWPAAQAGRESADAFADYLRGYANDAPGEAWFGDPAIGGRFDFDAELLTGFNHDRKLATIDQLLDLLLRQRGSAEPWGIYAGALPLATHLPGFAAANAMPLLDADRHMLVSLWLGNRTKTAAHWDLPQNLACVVLGRRKFTLFPPDQIANLYIGPIDFTLAGQPTSMVDAEDPDLDHYPRFADALAAAEIAELEPGDALYLPSLWWHAVHGRDELGAMVNYWWRDGPARMVTPMHSLLHAAMTMHELPEHERAAWKAHFDHYIFRANGDPVAHLPEAARGILGARTADLIAALRERLAKGLGNRPVSLSFPIAYRDPVTPPLPYPALHASHGGVWIATPEETRAVSRGEAIRIAADTPILLLNAPLIGQRLGHPELNGLDLLELFAFLRPARFMVPTPKGLARAAGIDPPASDAEVAPFLRDAAEALLALADTDWPEREGAWNSVQSLFRLRWPWAPAVSQRIAKPEKAERWLFSKLPEWSEAAPRAAPRTITLDDADVAERLATLTGSQAEQRQGQRDYAAAAARAFAPREMRDAPNLVLAEAGTGIGKTLGYLAPASLWSQQADGAVWISTFTKALQRQLGHESERLFPDEVERKKRIVTRKGRENYVCLLNLEDALQGGFAGRAAILAQLVARWAAYTADGDMIGGDLPGWLPTLFRRNGSTALTDRRGECIYAGCPHYRKCFIERSARASAEADIVIANHALVMVNAARGREAANRPTRYVFDEGHHLFDAADAMFSAALTGQEAIELRRWVTGPESGARGRRRGLAARLSDVASYDVEGGEAIAAAVIAAQALPSDQWLQRLGEGQPFGPVESLLASVRGLVFARDDGGETGYGLETELAEPDPALVEAAGPAAQALDSLLRPLVTLGRRLEAVLAEAPDWMDGAARARIEGAIASLGWRTDTVGAWLALIARIGGPADPEYVDWLAVDRVEGREYDVGLHRHWLDPSRPFAKTVLEPAHGAVITSATLKAGGDWDLAEARTGATHLLRPPGRFEAQSPFDYANQAQVLIVTDVKRGDLPALANAYARLTMAAEGGTLGLFTAIRRLRAVHARIADRLAREGLPLLAQHVDPIDTGTLVDIFRDDPRTSLIGTDALRDGVDVPGHSLRLVVMEGVPWPKPTVLHAARRLAGGGTAYDDRIVRARLAQAFGRLIRRADDSGSFVLLSAAMPSRLLTAFPDGTPIARVTLDEAVERVRLSLATRLRHEAPAPSRTGA